MSGHKPWWRKAWEMIVPPMTDFHARLAEQADKLEAASAALRDYLEDADPAKARAVNERVREGHALREQNLTLLHRSFITPIDREDIYTLTMTMDHILDYFRNTVREVEVLKVEPDHWMRSMAEALHHGTADIGKGLMLLRRDKAGEVPGVVNTHHHERHVEKLYRKALAEMFDTSGLQDAPGERECLEFVIGRIKRREVYRHLSNAADRLDHAGEALRDISVKYE